jgi:small subunit ribosomal protein S20
MPNKQAAVKALRQTKKHTAHNRAVLSQLEVLTRLARRAITANTKEAATSVKNIIKALDKAAQKGIIKANTAARKKSRLMKALRGKNSKS